VQAGNYTLSVTLSDGTLEQVLETTVIVLVATTNQVPTANFTLDISSNPDILIDATASSDADGSIREYRWDFGDGTRFTGGPVDGVQVRHTYEQAGTFTIRLTVTDDDGATASTTQEVTVDTPNLRPAGSPDVVVIGFAGRCGIPRIIVIGCDAPEENKPYLDGSARTLQAITETFTELGYVTEYRSFAARLSSQVASSIDPPPPGYQDAEAYLTRVYNNWVQGFDNPTRVIAVGHSHGTVWMNILLFNLADIQFDYAISLDGVCTFWWADHANSIATYYDTRFLPRPFPLADGDPCNRLAIPGVRLLQDIKDVMPSNVIVNLEVMAQFGAVVDESINYRLDGSRQNIVTLEPKPNQGHTEVTQAGGEAMQWVVDVLRTQGLPEADVLSTASGDVAGDIKRQVPAPAGYQYVDAP
jgi:PKD repeat protein